MIHTDEKKQNCHLCNKGFIDKSQLKRHIGLHTGYKPFSCSFCQRAFIQKSNMKLHAAKCSDKPKQ